MMFNRQFSNGLEMKNAQRELPAAARRALAEAARRRAEAVNKQAQGEVNGPKGPEPTRYGDWEKKGIVSDF